MSHDPKWSQDFVLEHDRIVQALGLVEHGGVLEWVQHVGSTAVAGIAAKPVLDIALVVHPFPLTESKREMLEHLGYQHRGEAGIPGRDFFCTVPRTRHLHVFGVDAPAFFNHLFLRDHLRAHRQQALEYESLKLELAARFRFNREAYTNGKGALISRLLIEAQAWHVAHTGFKPLLEGAKSLQGFRGDWLISSGWALDLWQGSPSRSHHDLDVVVWRDELPLLKTFLLEQGWDAQVVIEAGKYKAWTEVDAALELPVSQVHARKRTGQIHDLTSTRFLDFLISERNSSHWWWRGNPSITAPLEHVGVASSLGLRMLAPEIALFFKARPAMREKDQADFVQALPKLTTPARDWLRSALQQKLGDHPWLAQL